MQTVPGARALFAVRATALGWHVLSTLIWLLPIGDHFDLWFRLSAIVWLALCAAELAAVVPFSQGRQGTPAETAARALLIFLAVVFVLSVVQALPELGAKQMAMSSSVGRALGLAETVLWLATDVCLWLSLQRSLSDPPAWSGAFYALVALSGALSALHLVLSPDEYLKLYHDPALGALLRWGRFAVAVSLQALPLLLLRRLITGGAAPAEAAAPVAKNSPGRDIAIGAIWLGGGLLVTLISYSAVSESGGRYVVASGAIAYGLVRLVRGFVKL